MIKLIFFSILSVVSQAYTVNILEESVLRGNAAILKCHISTFVTEYVSVSSWIISEGDIEELEIQHAESQDLGIFISVFEMTNPNPKLFWFRSRVSGVHGQFNGRKRFTRKFCNC